MKASDDDWWEKEFRDRPDGNRDRTLKGNSIKLMDPVNENEKYFKINTAKTLIECIRVMAKRFKKKERTYVVFISEEQYDLFKGDTNECE